MASYLIFNGFKAGRKKKKRLSARQKRKRRARRARNRELPARVEKVKIIAETEKAYLVRNMNGKEAWFPKAWFIKCAKIKKDYRRIKIREDRWKLKFPRKR